VFDADLTPLLANGSALVAALVDPDGEPVAIRAFGVVVVTDDPPVVRVALQRGEIEGAGYDPAAPDAAIAVTGALVRTLDSLQLKGRVVQVEPPDERDLAVIHEHLEAFKQAVEEKDHIPGKLLEYIFPEEFEMATVEVRELFDQTPGPTAGSLLGRVEP
jgi:hypothetical protein